MRGADFPLDRITEEARIGDMMGRLARGNHQSASQKAAFLEAALTKEVKKGWLLPLPASRAKDIPSLEMAPLGVATHVGINAEGEFVTKDRVTHDLSFPGDYLGTSINDRVIPEELEPCMFGHMLS